MSKRAIDNITPTAELTYTTPNEYNYQICSLGEVAEAVTVIGLPIIEQVNIQLKNIDKS